MGKYRGKPKGAMRKAKASNATGARFNRCSTADATKGVTGVLFTYNDCHNINAMREMTNWVMETVDILYPKSPEEEKLESQAVSDNKKLIDEFYAKLADFKAYQAEHKSKHTKEDTDKSNTALPSTANDGDAFDVFATEEHQDDLDLGDDGGMMLFGGNFSTTEGSASNEEAASTEAVEEKAEDSEEPQRKRARLDSDTSSAPSSESNPPTASTEPKGPTRPVYPTLRPVSRVMELDLGLRGVGFLHVMKEGVDIVRVCRHMLETQMLEEKKVKTRYIMRILPIVSSCFASMESAEKLAETLIPQMFENIPENASYSTHIDRRTKNDNIPREDLQKLVGAHIPRNKGYVLDNKNPDYSVIIQVIGRVILMGLAPAFNKLGKYNPQTLADQVTVGAKKNTENGEDGESCAADAEEKLGE